MFTCPVCGESLEKHGGTLGCANGHSYDIAKQGYVNLLMSNASGGKRHGDDKAMVAARSAFLDAGCYDNFRDGIVDAAREYFPAGMPVLDAGCGEGFYSFAVHRALGGDMAGVDISKTALIAASKRGGGMKLAVAGVNRLPLANGSCGGILNIFAPTDSGEFWRVLAENGILLRGVPGERHLMELKAAVYDSPYLNPKPDAFIPGFELIDRRAVSGTIHLPSQSDIQNLFMMTPYYYKTGRADQEKLEKLSSLETFVDFEIQIYKKQNLSTL